MAVKVVVDRPENNIDDFTEDNVNTYTYQEDVTTVDPGNFDGGIGQISVTIPDRPRSKALMGANLSVTDTTLGTAPGVVRNLTSGASGDLQITADASLTVLNAYVTAKPFLGTLNNAMTYYFGLVSLAAPTVDATITSRSVTYPGFKGNLWDHIKQLCAAEQIELVLVGSTPTLRPLYANTYTVERETDYSWTLDQQQSSKIVRMHYYGNKYVNDAEVYPVPPTPPLPGEDPTVSQPDIYSVDANQTYTVDIQLNASMDNVNQPTCIDFVYNQSYAGTNGVYAVAGNDGLPITAAQWNAMGGKLTVSVTDDPSIIRVTIVGANIPAYAPFQIAMTAGDSSYYNALHITGDGVITVDQVVDIYTGATDKVTGDDIGVEVTNPYIDTLSKALYTGQRTAGAQCLSYTISGSVDTFNSADSAIFGKVPGALIRYDDAMFRITDATNDATQVQVNATMNTRVSDFNSIGLTTAQFNSIWANRTCGDFSVQPLRASA